MKLLRVPLASEGTLGGHFPRGCRLGDWQGGELHMRGTFPTLWVVHKANKLPNCLFPRLLFPVVLHDNEYAGQDDQRENEFCKFHLMLLWHRLDINAIACLVESKSMI